MSVLLIFLLLYQVQIIYSTHLNVLVLLIEKLLTIKCISKYYMSRQVMDILLDANFFIIQIYSIDF